MPPAPFFFKLRKGTYKTRQLTRGPNSEKHFWCHTDSRLQSKFQEIENYTHYMEIMQSRRAFSQNVNRPWPGCAFYTDPLAKVVVSCHIIMGLSCPKPAAALSFNRLVLGLYRTWMMGGCNLNSSALRPLLQRRVSNSPQKTIFTKRWKVTYCFAGLLAPLIQNRVLMLSKVIHLGTRWHD